MSVSPEWLNVPDDYEDSLGFVYVIEHTETGCYYIGKKQFWKTIRRKPLKGRKRVRVCKVESDWRTYWGSSNALQDAIAENGHESFTRSVVRTCNSKFELAYEELREQMRRNVLDDPKSFNGIINVRLSKPVGNPMSIVQE